jgi:predicted nucleotidyltransferase
MDPAKKYPLLREAMEPNLDELYCLAMQKAKLAALLLKERYAASHVVLFGSLTQREMFSQSSDIDLAVSGIPDELFFAAVGSVMDVVSPFEVDMVDPGDCRESIRQVIMRDGVEL